MIKNQCYFDFLKLVLIIDLEQRNTKKTNNFLCLQVSHVKV